MYCIIIENKITGSKRIYPVVYETIGEAEKGLNKVEQQVMFSVLTISILAPAYSNEKHSCIKCGEEIGPVKHECK